MSRDPFAAGFDQGETDRYAGRPRSANPHHGRHSGQAHRGYDSGWLWGDERMAERLERNAALEEMGL